MIRYDGIKTFFFGGVFQTAGLGNHFLGDWIEGSQFKMPAGDVGFKIPPAPLLLQMLIPASHRILIVEIYMVLQGR